MLAGRRADKRPSLRSPILGVVLLGVGIAGSAYGATSASSGEFAIAASAVVAVIGHDLPGPDRRGRGREAGRAAAAVAAVRRPRRRSPPDPHRAGRRRGRGHRRRRGRARHRRHQRRGRERGRPTGARCPTGIGIGRPPTPTKRRSTGPTLRAAAVRELPDATLTEVHGVIENSGEDGAVATGSSVTRPWTGRAGPVARQLSAARWARRPLVGDAVRRTCRSTLPATERAAAAASARCGRGRGLHRPRRRGRARSQLVAHRWDGRTPTEESVDPRRRSPRSRAGRLGQAGPQAILSERGRRRSSACRSATAGLLVSGADLREQQEAAREEALSAIDAERLALRRARLPGRRRDRGRPARARPRSAAILMLGGTLTATFLALSDARPDLATLAAVGASPRRRRVGRGVVRPGDRLRRRRARRGGRLHPRHRGHLPAHPRRTPRSPRTSSTSRG